MRRPPRVPLAALSFVLLLAVLPRVVLAASCGQGGGPWVSVKFGEGAGDEAFRNAVVQDLHAGVASSQLAACDAAHGPARPASAEIIITDGTQALSLKVEVRDAVTRKQVSREIDLSSVPSDGRAFAVALATDELLWATWAELALMKDEASQPQAPPEIVRGVAQELPARSEERATVWALRAGLEHFTAGQTQFGGDLAFVNALSRRLWLDMALGYRQGLSIAATHGSVSSRGVGVTPALRWVLASSAAGQVEVGVGARALLLRFEGQAEPGANAGEFSTLVVDARGLLSGILALSKVWNLEAAAGAGWALRSAEATDAGQVVRAASGLELLGTLGLGVKL
jgi:hypothetical protein